MADPTFVDLQDEVLSRDYGATVDRTNAKLWINAANRDVHGAHRWSWAENFSTLTSVAGTATITLPTAMLWPGRIRPLAANAPELVWVDPGSAMYGDLILTSATGVTGTPEFIYRLAGSFRLEPTPDAVYTWTFHFWRKATIMTADADEPNMPEDDREILVYGALKRAAERDRDTNMMQYWANEYSRKLDEMKQKDALLTQAPRTVRMPRVYRGRFDRGR